MDYDYIESDIRDMDGNLIAVQKWDLNIYTEQTAYEFIEAVYGEFSIIEEFTELMKVFRMKRWTVFVDIPQLMMAG